MKRKVLAPFHYAHDRVHANLLKAGRSYDFRADVVAEFEAQGLIERATPPVAGRTAAKPAARGAKTRKRK